MDGSINRTFGYVFGGTYVLVGLVGFAVTGGIGFAASQGKNLIFFGVNPLHNLVHIAVGALLLIGAPGRDEAQAHGVFDVDGCDRSGPPLLGVPLAGDGSANSASPRTSLACTSLVLRPRLVTMGQDQSPEVEPIQPYSVDPYGGNS